MGSSPISGSGHGLELEFSLFAGILVIALDRVAHCTKQ